jgi:lipid A 3-O-deacylase
MRLIGCLLAALIGLGVAPALAQGPAKGPAEMARSLGVLELRGGAMIDDVELYGLPYAVVPIVSSWSLDNLHTASFDVLFRSPEVDAFRWIGSPRPVIGADVNFTHESMLHAGLNWHIPIFNTGAFIEPELGGAIHNGALTGAVAPYRNLGCRALFFWSLSIGYQIDEHWDITATEQHGSQYGICGWDNNRGLNYDGIRIGYKF